MAVWDHENTAPQHEEERLASTPEVPPSPTAFGGSNASESVLEKGDAISVLKERRVATHVEEATDDDAMEANAAMMQAVADGDPFPEIPNVPDETQFTLRALVVGCACGALIGAADIYLGLKTGNSIGGNHFGAIAGFAMLQAMARFLPTIARSDPQLGEVGPVTLGTNLRRFFKLGGRFGPKENVTIMCAATAAASNGVAFYAAVPALYQLKLMGPSPRADFGKLVCLAAVCAYFGSFFAVPFRKLYILDFKLRFPGAVASSITIRTLHTAKGAAANKKRVRALVIAFSAAFIWRVVASYAPGILWSWHPFWALRQAGVNGAIGGDNWTWYIQWSPAFIGSGMIIGPTAAMSITGGQVLAWGIIGPALVASGAAVGAKSKLMPPDYTVYTGVSPPLNGAPPSPRYWLLWPGLVLILASTLTEVAVNGKTFAKSLAQVGRQTYATVTKKQLKHEADAIPDPAPPSQRIPAWMWFSGAVLVAIFTCVVMAEQFHQTNIGPIVLAIFLTVMFSFLTCESLGRIGIPISSIASSLTQLIILAWTVNAGYSPLAKAFTSIMASTITSSAGQQVGDMVTDLKVAHFIGASPRKMFYAQCIGAIVATVLSPAVFLLFAESYPCILNANAVATCTYQVPSSIGFRAIPLIASSAPVPLGSILTSVFLALIAMGQTLARHWGYIPKKYHAYLPSWMAVGLGLMLPIGSYGIAFMIGCGVLFTWKRFSPVSAVLLAFPVASGMVAGEGIGGIMNAILSIAKVGGDTYGTIVGCPWGEWCG